MQLITKYNLIEENKILTKRVYAGEYMENIDKFYGALSRKKWQLLKNFEVL